MKSPLVSRELRLNPKINMYIDCEFVSVHVIGLDLDLDWVLVNQIEVDWKSDSDWFLSIVDVTSIILSTNVEYDILTLALTKNNYNY